MKLFEYQAKQIFKDAGIMTPKSVLIRNADEMAKAAETVGLPCVVKSQVLTGGRGKAGLIKVAATVDEAVGYAANFFNSDHNVHQILIEEAVDFVQEIYFSITVDPVEAKILILGSSQGGVDIETLAREEPKKIVSCKVDPGTGLTGFHINNLLFGMGFSGDIFKQMAALVRSLFKVFKQYDAELVEINPLFITRDGSVMAGDGKLNIDDSAMYRHSEFPMGREYFSSDAEFEAAQDGIPYLQFDGNIALMCAGAGLTTTVYDLINYAGGSVANYLEFGGPNYRKGVRAMELCLMNEAKVILVVTFGTIARADVVAQGLVEAIETLKPQIPIVACIRGTNEDKADQILRQAGIEPLYNTELAVQTAVELAAKRSNR